MLEDVPHTNYICMHVAMCDYAWITTTGIVHNEILPPSPAAAMEPKHPNALVNNCSDRR